MQAPRQQDKQNVLQPLRSELFGETIGEAGDKLTSKTESSIKDKKQSVNTKPGIGGLQLPGPGRRYRFLLPRVVPVQNDGGSTSGLSDLTTGSSSPSLSVSGSITVPSESMSLCSPTPSPPASPTLDQTEEKGEKRVQKRIYRARQDRLNTLPNDQALSDDQECDELLRNAREQGEGDPLCPFPGCIINFNTTRGFTTHLQTVHNIERSDRSDRVRCLIPGCLSSCRPKDSCLLKHYKLHVVKNPCPYPHCDVVLGRVSDMRGHVKKVHGVTVKNARYFTSRFVKFTYKKCQVAL